MRSGGPGTATCTRPRRSAEPESATGPACGPPVSPVFARWGPRLPRPGAWRVPSTVREPGVDGGTSAQTLQHLTDETAHQTCTLEKVLLLDLLQKIARAGFFRSSNE